MAADVAAPVAGGSVPQFNSSAAEMNTAVVAASSNVNSTTKGQTTQLERIFQNYLCKSHSEALMNGLNQLRCSRKLFDVTLIVEGRRFNAHRVVLAACSDYFCAMFTDPMRESNQSEITLNGISARGIEILIDYAYTSNLELNRSNVQDVLAASTLVQMRAAIDACSAFLEAEIDLENCVGIAALADLYSLEALKKKAYRYICLRLGTFSKTSEFLQLTWDQMEYILACNYPVNCPEEYILRITLRYCFETNLKPELVRTLLAKVHFNQISMKNLEFLTSGLITTNNKDECPTEMIMDSNEPGVVYYKYIRAEKLKQEQILSKSLLSHSADSSSVIEEIIPEKILINSRGMELALVKIGGFETSGLTNQISCFLPSKGKWEILTKIPHIEQCNYGTAVLGNDLYIVGGSYDVCLKEYIHPFGFRYCPTKNNWKTIAPIQADRCRFSLNAMGDQFLYAVGGICDLNENDGSENWANDLATSNCERYNSVKDRWEYLPPLLENRSQHAGVVIGDKLYISGGIDRHLVLPTLWCFDTQKEVWNKLCSMPTPRADHVLLAIDNRIYACGGWYEDAATETRVLAETIDVYDINTNRWTTETTNPLPKYYTGVSAIKHKIYFIGGLLSTATINRATASVQCYDLDAKTWSMSCEWEYPHEVWECTCAAFYVPRERDDFNCEWDNAE